MVLKCRLTRIEVNSACLSYSNTGNQFQPMTLPLHKSWPGGAIRSFCRPDPTVDKAVTSYFLQTLHIGSRHRFGPVGGWVGHEPTARTNQLPPPTGRTNSLSVGTTVAEAIRRRSKGTADASFRGSCDVCGALWSPPLPDATRHRRSLWLPPPAVYTATAAIKGSRGCALWSPPLPRYTACTAAAISDRVVRIL